MADNEVEDLMIGDENTIWEEVEPKGKTTCPVCNKIFLIIATMGGVYAYCINCKKYFVMREKCPKCGSIHSLAQIHQCKDVIRL